MYFVPAIVFLSLFAVACTVHLVICFKENEKLRVVTKPICLPFLVAGIICLVPSYPLVWLFPLLSWIGDILLIWKKKKRRFFIIGTSFFWCGHSCILAQLIIILTKSGFGFPPIVYVAFGILTLLICVLCYPLSKKKAGILAICGSIYFPYLVSICLFCMVVAGSMPGSYEMILTAIGYILFIFSDAYLIFTNFIEPKKRSHFVIMLTYFMAEIVITLSLAMFLIS